MNHPRPTPAQIAAAQWTKSTYSAANNECVEIATPVPAWIAVRDSKGTDGPALILSAGAFGSLVRSVTAGTI
jgi:hypothetical protein